MNEDDKIINEVIDPFSKEFWIYDDTQKMARVMKAV